MTSNSTSPPPVTKTYEGKAKRVSVCGAHEVDVFFKDDATAFNGVKHAVIPGKGAMNCAISAMLFEHLAERGITSHFIKQTDERTLRCRHAIMFPLEVIVRFKAAGSLVKRTGLPAGSTCDPPVIEFYFKRDDLGDPMVNFDHIRMLHLASAEEVAMLSTAGLKAAQALHKLCKLANIDLVDIKFEYGRTPQGVVLADEISPDTCRLHDIPSGRMLDKDLFRQDAGDLMTGYREVHDRLRAALEGLKNV